MSKKISKAKEKAFIIGIEAFDFTTNSALIKKALDTDKRGKYIAASLNPEILKFKPTAPGQSREAIKAFAEEMFRHAGYITDDTKKMDSGNMINRWVKGVYEAWGIYGSNKKGWAYDTEKQAKRLAADKKVLDLNIDYAARFAAMGIKF